jgi:acyl dehydratase
MASVGGGPGRVMTRIRQDWDLLQVGETFGPYRYVVRPEVVEALRAAVGDDELTVVDGEAVAPAMLLTFPFLQLIEAKYEPPPGVIHAGQEFDLYAPVRVGAVLTCTGTITDKSVRRDRRYYSVSSQAVDERAVLVARSRTTAVYPAIDLRSP